MSYEGTVVPRKGWVGKLCLLACAAMLAWLIGFYQGRGRSESPERPLSGRVERLEQWADSIAERVEIQRQIDSSFLSDLHERVEALESLD